MTRRLPVAALLLAWPAVGLGLTFHVPGQQPSIQAAINLASPSIPDTVLVAGGVYNERLKILSKAVVLKGQGADLTTIDGRFGGNVVTVTAVGRNCIIEDLTVTGGDANGPDSVGAAIYLNNFASPTIQRCHLTGNRARAGGGINAYVMCQPLVRDCRIDANAGGAVVFELGDADQGHTYAVVENCVIVNNQGFGCYVLKGARVTWRNCTIAFNASDGLRSDQIARVRVFNSIITNNQGAGITRLDNTVCFTLACNDVYSNVGGNYVGANPGDACFSGRGSGDVSIDPCYQNVATGNFHLQLHSPLCALRSPDSCGVLGAYTDPCAPGNSPCIVHVEQRTWGGVKTLYR